MNMICQMTQLSPLLPVADIGRLGNGGGMPEIANMFKQLRLRVKFSRADIASMLRQDG